MDKIEAFAIHGESGVIVLKRDFLKWLETHSSSELGTKIAAYSWAVGDQTFEVAADLANVSWHELPDASGFICFEKPWVPNNCLLLDVYGKERMRLTVPWQLTKPQNPESAKPPTSFARVSPPFINPVDGKEGKFGVNAWVEHAGTYYFELDYHSGQFLWGREIRD
jgi:hypothetical protein